MTTTPAQRAIMIAHLRAMCPYEAKRGYSCVVNPDRSLWCHLCAAAAELESLAAPAPAGDGGGLVTLIAQFRAAADEQDAIIARENDKGIYSNDFAFLKAARIYRECADMLARALTAAPADGEPTPESKFSPSPNRIVGDGSAALVALVLELQAALRQDGSFSRYLKAMNTLMAWTPAAPAPATPPETVTNDEGLCIAHPEPVIHRCAGCGHHWEGRLTGPELCGDCWRKVRPSLHDQREAPSQATPPTMPKIQEGDRVLCWRVIQQP